MYDFMVPKCSTIIRCQGTYWHADKRFHLADDLICFPGQKPVCAKHVWAVDEHKDLIARQNGYDVLHVWEYDIKSNPSLVREKLESMKCRKALDL